MPRISKRIIATLQPAEKDYIVWDDQVAGFALRVWPSGRMSYVFIIEPMAGSDVIRSAIMVPGRQTKHAMKRLKSSLV